MRRTRIIALVAMPVLLFGAGCRGDVDSGGAPGGSPDIGGSGGSGGSVTQQDGSVSQQDGPVEQQDGSVEQQFDDIESSLNSIESEMAKDGR